MYTELIFSYHFIKYIAYVVELHEEKNCKYSRANFNLKLLRLSNFHVTSYFLSIVLFLLNLDLFHLKIIATHLFSVSYTIILLH